MVGASAASAGTPRWIAGAWLWLPAFTGLLVFVGLAVAQRGGSAALAWWVGGGISCSAAYAMRERWPVGALVLSLAVVATARLPGIDVLGDEFGVAYLLLLLVPVLPLVAVSSRLRLRWSLLALPVTIAVEVAISPAPAWSVQASTTEGRFVQYVLTVGVPLMIGTGAWLAGCVMLERERRIAALLERAATLERARDADAARAVAEQRAQVARELHDVVTHTVAVMVVQASAATTVLDRDPDEARAAMLAVQQSGRTAMAELRGVLASLDCGHASARQATPGLERLSDLVEQIRAAGLTADLHVHGSPDALPATTALSLLRIAQESVTNVLRHACATSMHIDVDVGDEIVRLTVSDDGIGYRAAFPTRPDGEGGSRGRGLIGMRERAKLLGGTFDIAARSDGGTTVTVIAPAGGSART